MTLGRRAFIVGAGATVGLARAAGAAVWPDRPVTLLVPSAPGGANDLVTRIFARRLTAELGQTVVVENRAGAGGVAGSARVAKARADGYTLLVGANGIITNTLIRSDQPFADDDLVPIAPLGSAPSVIVVRPSDAAVDLRSFADETKRAGGRGLPFATAGLGSTPNFVMGMIMQQTGALLESIPYKSGSESVASVVGGQTAATSEASIVTLPLVQDGRLRALATTSTHRLSSAPDIPTATEQGFPGIRIGHWQGLFAPAGTPVAVLDTVNAAVNRAARAPELVEALARVSIEPGGGSRADFARFIEDERARLASLVKGGFVKAG